MTMDVPQIEAEIEGFRQSYNGALRNALTKDLKSLSQDEAVELRSELHAKAITLFNAFERSLDIYDGSSTYITKDYRRAKYGDAVNYCEMLIKYWTLVRRLEEVHQLTSLLPSVNAYGSIQRAVNKTAPKEQIGTFRARFQELKLPTMAFDNRNKHNGFINPKERFTRLQLWIGTPFLLLTIVLAFLNPEMTGIQYHVIRVVLALSVSVVGSSLVQDNIQIKWTFQKSLAIRAAGWVAVFVLLYFANPPAPPSPFPAP